MRRGGGRKERRGWLYGGGEKEGDEGRAEGEFVNLRELPIHRYAGPEREEVARPTMTGRRAASSAADEGRKSLAH